MQSYAKPLYESPEKRGCTVSAVRLGMNPQAAWLRRINPAFKQLGAVVSKHARLVARSPLKAPFMGRSSVALAFRACFRMPLTAVYRRSASAAIGVLLRWFCLGRGEVTSPYGTKYTLKQALHARACTLNMQSALDRPAHTGAVPHNPTSLHNASIGRRSARLKVTRCPSQLAIGDESVSHNTWQTNIPSQ